LGLNKPPRLLLGSLFRITGINCLHYRSDTGLAKPEEKIEKLIGKDALPGG
jgi:hypothetical protein